MANTSDADPWKKLLEVSTSITTNVEDLEAVGAGPSDAKPEKDDMEFLKKAMSTLASSSQPAVFTLCRDLELFQKAIVSDRMPLGSLVAATDLAEQIDEYLIAGNFCDEFMTDAVFEAMENLSLNATDNELRLAYLQLLPEFAGNRPAFQERFSKSPFFSHLIDKLDDFESTPSFITAAILSALAATVNSCLSAWNVFSEKNGVEKFVKLVEKHLDDAVAAKAARHLDTFYFNNYSVEAVAVPSNKAGFEKLLDGICESLAHIRRRKAALDNEMIRGLSDKRTIDLVEEAYQLIVGRICTLEANQLSDKAKKHITNLFDSLKNTDEPEKVWRSKQQPDLLQVFFRFGQLNKKSA